MDSQGYIIDPLGRALFGKTRRAVLALFLGNEERSFYLRSVARQVSAGHGAVQRELSRLVDAGILERSVDGRQVYFRVNRECPIFTELRGLMLKTAGAAGVLREHLSRLAERIRVAFLFGSIAKGTGMRASDVDVMVIGDVSFGEVVQALLPAQDQLSREVNAIVYPPREFSRKLAARHHFLTRVLDDAKVFLIGDESDLKRLAQGGMAKRAPDKSPRDRRSARRRGPRSR